MILCLLAALLFPRAPGPGLQAPAHSRGVLVDALRASVNHQAITASAVRQAAWYSRLVTDLHRGGAIPFAVPPLSAAERHQALDHLISQVLLSEARRDAAGHNGAAPPPARAAAIDQQLQRMEALAGGAAAWPGVLHRYHLSMPVVRAILARQMALLFFADAHCRREAHVTAAEVAAYYRQSLLPAARRAHIRPAALSVIAPRIRAILLQRQLLRLELQWIHRLRSQARVRIFPAPLMP